MKVLIFNKFTLNFVDDADGDHDPDNWNVSGRGFQTQAVPIHLYNFL